MPYHIKRYRSNSLPPVFPALVLYTVHTLDLTQVFWTQADHELWTEAINWRDHTFSSISYAQYSIVLYCSISWISYARSSDRAGLSIDEQSTQLARTPLMAESLRINHCLFKLGRSIQRYYHAWINPGQMKDWPYYSESNSIPFLLGLLWTTSSVSYNAFWQ